MILVPEKMAAGIGQEPNLEKQIRKQMGCMAGFFQIFDRHQILTGKRLCSPNSLDSGPLCDSTRETQESVGSPAMSSEPVKTPLVRSVPSPDPFKKSEIRSPAPEPATPSQGESKASLPLPVFDFKEGTRSSWKFSKEAPRLSLDSRAVVDAKGSLKPREIRTNASILSPISAANDDGDKQRRSPSVIARLMGLEAMMESEPEPEKKVELRRSASESRVSRDLFQNRFIDGVNLQVKQSQPMNSYSNVVAEERAKHDPMMKNKPFDHKEYNARTARAELAKVPHRGIGQRKCFYDSADFFPEPKQTVSVYNELEKRLRQRGIDEPSKDLETLRHILEALQLKGLLHSNKQYSSPANSRNFVYEQSYPSEDSPIVLMKPGRRLSADFTESYRSEPGGRQNPNFTDDFVSPRQRRDRPEIERNVRNQIRGRSSVSPVRSEIGAKSPNRRRPWSVESRRENDLSEQRRVSPIQSPRFAPRRNGSDPAGTRSPRSKNPTVEIKRKVEKVLVPAEDESSVSGCSLISANSQMDAERWRGEERRGGRNLLERCDKLLQSIAEMSTTTTTTTTTTELQPSPVSVLDSSFCKEESSPSPVMKRSIDFKEVPFEWEDDTWSPPPAMESKSDDCDFLYICDVLRATNYLSDDPQLFQFLEKQQYLKGQDTCNASMLQRKLIFDTITEILSRKRQLPPWTVVSCAGQTCLQQVWSEFQQIKERDEDCEDLVQVICGVLRKDLAGDAVTGWADCPIEMSEAVLDMERLIFKDLIGETIRDLAAVSAKSCSSNRVQVVSRRKLVF